MSEFPTNFVPLAPVQLVRPNGAVRAFGLGAASNSARGTALLAALSAASAGDAVALGPGTFDVGTTQVVLPAGGAVRGMGQRLTTISSARAFGDGVCVRLTNDSELAHVKVLGTLSAPSSQYPVGSNSTAFTNARLHNVWIVAASDGLFVSTTALSSLAAWGLEIDAQFDCVRVDGISGIHQIDLYEPKLSAIGPFGANESRAVAIARGIVNIYGGKIVAQDGGATTTAGLYTDGTNATINMHGGSIATSASSGAAPTDCKRVSGTINIRGVRGSGTGGVLTTSGTVTVLDTLGNLAPTSAGLALLDDANADAQRRTLGIVTAHTFGFGSLTSLSDSSTYIFGHEIPGTLPNNGAGLRRIWLPKGRIVGVKARMFPSNAGVTSENATLYVRKNDTTDTEITNTLAFSSSAFTPTDISNMSLAIDVDSGDSIEFKLVTPNYATNPTGAYIGGQLYLQQ